MEDSREHSLQTGIATGEVRISPPKVPCPTCRRTGKLVDTLTLKALLAVPLTEIRTVGYRFCPTPGCPTVYYSVDGSQSFDEGDVRERVYQKHPHDDDVFVCYCFRHTRGSIKEELARTGISTVIATISAGIQFGRCACDIRNPQGICCLGNVRKSVQQLEAQLRERQREWPHNQVSAITCFPVWRRHL